MKRIALFLLTLVATAAMAEEFTVGYLTFQTISDTQVKITKADEYTHMAYLSSTVTHQGVSYSVTEIHYSAFSGCSSLQSVTIPSSVTTIGSSAFEGCTSLQSITIPSSVTTIGHDAFKNSGIYNNPALWTDGALYIDDCLIAVDTAIVGDYHVRENTRMIGGGAFYDCKHLTSVSIPSSVTRIGDSAFRSCESLTSVSIPSSVTEIGGYAFYYCKSLSSVNIPSSITEISGGIFGWCESLNSFTIHSNVTSIGQDAFSFTGIYNNPALWSDGALYLDGCLISLVPSFVGDYHVRENTRIIADGAFYYCESLTSVTIPKSVTRIGTATFADCYALASITIPSSVTSISEWAFNFHSLTSIVVEEGNPVYDSRDNCNAIIHTATNKLILGGDNTIIPSSVTSISINAFPQYPEDSEEYEEYEEMSEE